MDKIILKGLKFNACHGVFAHEKTDPQPFEVDIVIEADLKPPGHTDSLQDTLDYGSVYQDVKQLMESRSFNLIEALAQAMADQILKRQMVSRVVVTIKKFRPPISGFYDYFAVEIDRSRN